MSFTSLMINMWRVSSRYCGGLEVLHWGVYNPRVAVSAMSESNLQGMIYYIKHFYRIGRTCTHANVELSKVCALHHKWYIEESHKYP